MALSMILLLSQCGTLVVKKKKKKLVILGIS